MLRGTRRPANSTLNTPVAIHSVGPATHLSKDEVLQFLSGFIQEKESIPAVTLASESSTTQGSITSGGIGADEAAVDTQLSSALAQLKRVERDFKGLPPQVLESGSNERSQEATPSTDTVAASATGGKKIKFADVAENTKPIDETEATAKTKARSSTDSSSSDEGSSSEEADESSSDSG